jgi:uncharacterized protein (TIGR02145 family)
MLVRFACLMLLLAGLSVPLVTTTRAATPEQRAEDLSVYETRVLAPDKSFSTAARARANALLASLKRDAGTLNDARFQLRLAEISAQAGNGHTLLYNTAWKRHFNRLPLMFFISGRELHIAKAPANPELEGARVVAINGRSFDDLRKLWARYQAGPQGRRDDFLYAFLESPQMLAAAGVGATPDAVQLLTEKTPGQRRTTVVAGRSDIAPPTGTWATLPRPRIEELQALEPAEVRPPLYLRDLDTPFRIAHLGEAQAAYIQFRANFDPSGNNANPGRFSADAIRRLEFLAPRFVILDQRFNIGGDANRTRGLMEALPGIVGPNGHVFVLVSGRTFSAGISSVAYLKQAGGARVTIIGTDMGDGPSHWSEGTVTTLPHSRAVFLNALERHDYMNGCPGPECHWAEKERPVRLGRALTPDIRAEQTWSDYVAKRDPLLDAALAQIKAFPAAPIENWRNAIAINWRQNAPVPFTDQRDGRQYASLVFGSQVWMVENLAYLPKVCRVDENDCGFWVRDFNGADLAAAKQTQNYKTSGVLYDWSTAQTACPAGWRLPSDADWQMLEMSLGMPAQEAQTGGWRNETVAGRLIRGGDTGFNIEFGGARATNGVFTHSDSGIFWCSDEIGPNHGCERVFGQGRRQLGRDTGLKQAGFSVRCVRNS